MPARQASHIQRREEQPDSGTAEVLVRIRGIALLLAPPSFGYRECVRRCRVFVVGPGLFVSLSVFVRLFCSFVCSLRRWFVCRLVRSFVVGWLVCFGRRAVLLVPVVTAPDE